MIWGDRDTYASFPDQHRLVAMLPDARLTVYKGHGHAVHCENPTRVAGEIATFLAERVPDAAAVPA